jgi:diguanylate cyclase
VNVSVRQLEDPGFPGVVAEALAESGVPAACVCLELTETALMQAGGTPVEVLDAVRELGVYVAIDDFGTGHSSLARLRDLPVEVLKVDRSFVAGLGTVPEDTAVVASVLSLAHAMGLHVVAEGVETPLQARQLLDLGCSVAQGYLYSRPVPADAVPAAAAACAPRAVSSRRGRRRGGPCLIDEMAHQLGIAREAA